MKALLLFALLPFAALAIDSDNDGAADHQDNCRWTVNASQCDSDADGYGNHCDGDLNNNGSTNAQDIILFRAQLGQPSVGPTYNQADINCNGNVNAQDTVLIRDLLGLPSGPSGTVSRFPVTIEGTDRHLTDHQGWPFFINGDTPWDLIVGPTYAEAIAYLDDRRDKGVNTIMVELIEFAFSGPDTNEDDEAPFSTTNGHFDFGLPNDDYFDYALSIIQAAEARGMLVILSPSYMGFANSGEGWIAEMEFGANPGKMDDYGAYIGNKFVNSPNIMWAHGGDRAVDEDELALADVLANALILEDANGYWLHTFHGARSDSGFDTTEAEGGVDWLQVDSVYSGDNNVVAEALESWSDSDLPVFLLEAVYENAGGGGDGELIRRQAYQAILSGALAGHLIGNDPIWYFGTNNPGYSGPEWDVYLDSVGAESLPHILTLWESLDWHLLEPDVGNTFITAGFNSASSRRPAALASDGSFGIIYAPNSSPSTFTVALGELAGPTVTARWYDPTSGSYATASGSPFTTLQSTVFSLPSGTNAGGEDDWVLLLESAP